MTQTKTQPQENIITKIDQLATLRETQPPTPELREIIKKIPHYKEYKDEHRCMLLILLENIQEMCNKDNLTEFTTLGKLVYLFNIEMTDEEIKERYIEIIAILLTVYENQSYDPEYEIQNNPNFVTLMQYLGVLEDFIEYNKL